MLSNNAYDTSMWDSAVNSIQQSPEPVATESPLSLSLGLNAVNLGNTQKIISGALEAQQMQMDALNQGLGVGYNAIINSGNAQGGNNGGFKTKYGLEPQFWNSLGAANAAMKAAGLGTFSITSGYRTRAQQEKLYAAHLSGKKPEPVAKPGTSKHEIGLAADLNLTRAQQKWLEANGWKYGIGRIKSESWHWQPLSTLHK